ncbi:hypothetical protein LPB41_14300 [Thalassospira sp. MA62]|nr:hypothetical protein [Thalassospira sp. MA62]
MTRTACDDASDRYSFAISLQNSSGETLTVGYAMLSGGIWVPDAPTPGQPYTPGAFFTVQNVGYSSLSPVGGTISFTLASGGNVVLQWNRRTSEGPFASASSDSDKIDVNYSLLNAQSMNPTFETVITNA